jgi:ribose transport system ATP-binding protein
MTVTLSATELSKSYPGVRALDCANLDLRAGSIHALLGENGAGKSTLVKILTGVHGPDSGVLRLNGEQIRFSNPHDATRAGIGAVQQERNVIPLFSVAENISLQDMPRIGPFVDRRARDLIVRRVLDTLKLDIPANALVSDLSPAQVQLVEIGKALALESRVLIMDEPTASLTDVESLHLFDLLRRLRDSGTAIAFVSHKLEEVFELCDTITILRDGATVIEGQPIRDFSQRDVVNLMVGRTLAERPIRNREVSRTGVARLGLDALSTEIGHEDISIEVYPGEIVGLYGLVGAGRSELAQSILGLARITSGEVLIDGTAVEIQSVREALHKYRIGYVSEDRKNEGVFLDQSVRFNVAATVWGRLTSWTGIRPSREAAVADEAIKRLGIKVSSDQQLVGQLSGGNQQKVSLSKWLAASTDLLIIDEPTVGVDVRTKEEFQSLIMDLADRGLAILLIDSDLPEMIALADRIAVMRAFRITGVVNNSKDYAEMSPVVGHLMHGSPSTS